MMMRPSQTPAKRVIDGPMSLASPFPNPTVIMDAEAPPAATATFRGEIVH